MKRKGNFQSLLECTRTWSEVISNPQISFSRQAVTKKYLFRAAAAKALEDKLAKEKKELEDYLKKVSEMQLLVNI